ncbi:MAG: T9SS type A sorting domain-containing protein [Fibrobacter sp.]|nr:T9SS type A sorting domain-containing protein [Fibrobacter sp.]
MNSLFKKTWATTLVTGFAAFSFAASASSEYSWGNVIFEGGGFVDGIITSKTQEGLVYARTDVGGAYRFDKGSGKWIPLMDWISEQDRGLYGTEALALDPSDPTKLYILAGTSYFSNGKTVILRSSDYGNTFDTTDVTALFQAHGNGLGRQTGEKLAVDPNNSNIIYCGTRTAGLFKSTDAGKSWSLVAGTASLSGASVTSDIGISYVLLDASSGKASNGGTKDVYIGTASGTSTLYKSTDGGETFKAVSGAPSLKPWRAVMAGGYIFGTFSGGNGPDGSISGGLVYKYDLSTGAWTDISPIRDASTGTYYARSDEMYYSYGFGGISVDPNDANRLVLSTFGFYGGGNVWEDGSSNAGDEVFISEDGGKSWRTTQSWAVVNRATNGNGWISGGNIHWAGTVEFNPFDSKQVWIGSGNGVFRTDNVDAEVPMWTFMSKGIEETVPLVAESMPGGPLVTAIYDYDGATYDDILTTAPAHSKAAGSSGALGHAWQAGYLVRSGRRTEYNVDDGNGGTINITSELVQLSKDMGKTWTVLDTTKSPGAVGSDLGGIAMSTDGRVILMRPNNYLINSGFNGNKFYRTADEGNTWTEVEGLSAESGLMVADGQNPAKFYILPGNGYNSAFYASTDTGKTFTQISDTKTDVTNPGEYGAEAAGDGMLRVNPYVEGDLWMCMDAEQPWTSTGYSANGLAHSTDGGKTWTRLYTMDACLSIGLGKAPEDSDYPTLYMWGAANGENRGIYRSTDKGETWERINDDKHQYGGPANGKFVVGDWNIYGRVYMSTAGRGLVYGNIGELEPSAIPTVKALTGAISAGMKLQGRTLQITANGLKNAKVQLFDMNGKLVQSFNIFASSQSIDLQAFRKGAYIARLTSSQNIQNTQRILLK